MKRALVLSGGGAIGAFQVGALDYIQKHHPADFKFDIVAGVSVGSLNGALVAQNDFPKLLKLWNNIGNNKVYTGSMNMLSILWRVITGRKSLLGIKPLIKQIRDNVDIRRIASDFRFGFVSLTSGTYVTCLHTMFGSDNKSFRKAILASCSMPLIWEPVNHVNVGDKTYHASVDGGVRNTSPLEDITTTNPDEIIIITCFTQNINVEEDAAKNIFSIAKRAISDFITYEVFRDQLHSFLKTNEIIRQCTAKGITIYKDKAQTEPYKEFRAIVIEPGKDLGDLLDFSQPTIQMRMKAGYEAAEAAYSREMVQDINHYTGNEQFN